MKKDATIYVAGHRGMVGSAICQELSSHGFQNILTAPRAELDLTRQADVERFFETHKIDYVFIAAAKVGGIIANKTFPTEFLYDNVMIANNVIRAAAENKVEKLLFLGSSCIYPKFAPQPITESALLSDALEPTNEAYALGKIVSLKLCEYYNRQHGKRFISAMPCNLYGVGDNYHPEHSHVIPGLIRRIHEAKLNGDSAVTVWGSGTPKREFLNVKDLATALVKLMHDYEDSQTINVGSGQETQIIDLANLIKDVVGFEGEIQLDPSKPDGTPRKVLDVSRIQELGWKSEIDLADGLKEAYQWALDNKRI